MLHQQPDRGGAWLAPPATTIRLHRKLATDARRGLTVLRKAAQDAHPERLHRSRLAEADASSLIEGVNADPTDGNSYAGALAEAMANADGTTGWQEILRWHGRLLRDHPRPDIMSPGEYRHVGVRVGRWLPPPHGEVPQYMAQFHQWLEAEKDPLMRAVWGHRYFETIHPFADGNGRTGRLLIVATLQAPICISRALWWERNTYMELLADSSWQEWSEWMLEKIREEAYRTARDLRNCPLHDTDQRAARWLTQRPLPAVTDDMSLTQLMALQRQITARIELSEA